MMLLAMGLTAALCVLTGVAPGIVYRLLPFTTTYEPYTTDHVLVVLQLLVGTAVGFTLLLRQLESKPRVTLDADRAYRALGRWVVEGVGRRVAWAADRLEAAAIEAVGHSPWTPPGRRRASMSYAVLLTVLVLGLGIALLRTFTDAGVNRSPRERDGDPSRVAGDETRLREQESGTGLCLRSASIREPLEESAQGRLALRTEHQQPSVQPSHGMQDRLGSDLRCPQRDRLAANGDAVRLKEVDGSLGPGGGLAVGMHGSRHTPSSASSPTAWNACRVRAAVHSIVERGPLQDQSRLPLSGQRPPAGDFL